MRILLLDNNSESLDSIKGALLLNGYKVEGFTDINSARRVFISEHFDVVITDFHLTHNSKGTDLCDSINQKKKNVPIILMSGDPEIDLNRISNQNKVYKYFKKPIDIVSLLEELKKIESK